MWGESRALAPSAMGLAVSLAGLCYAPPSSACGANPSPEWTLGSTSPVDGAQGVPVNSGVRIVGLPWGEGNALSYYLDVLTVTAAGGGEPVAGTFLSWYGTEPVAVWAPSEPLAAQTQYDVYARVGMQQPASATAGSYETRFSFTTGDRRFPDLVMDGSLTVTTEWAERVEDVYPEECLTMCGPMCDPTGTQLVPGIRAIVTLPALHGGDAGQGYFGWLHYTMNEPATFAGPGEGRAPQLSLVNLFEEVTPIPNQPLSVEQWLIGEGEPYAPCFAFNVWDTGGQSVTSSVCLDVLDLEALVAQGPPPSSDTGDLPDAGIQEVETGDDESAGAPQDETPGGTMTVGGGCAIGGEAPRSAPLAWLLMALAGCHFALRARRSFGP